MPYCVKFRITPYINCVDASHGQTNIGHIEFPMYVGDD